MKCAEVVASYVRLAYARWVYSRKRAKPVTATGSSGP
jgi:hypothetical protein